MRTRYGKFAPRIALFGVRGQRGNNFRDCGRLYGNVRCLRHNLLDIAHVYRMCSQRLQFQAEILDCLKLVFESSSSFGVRTQMQHTQKET